MIKTLVYIIAAIGLFVLITFLSMVGMIWVAEGGL